MVAPRALLAGDERRVARRVRDALEADHAAEALVAPVAVQRREALGVVAAQHQQVIRIFLFKAAEKMLR